MIERCAGAQALLSRDEFQRVRRAHRDTWHVAEIAIQATWSVERKHRSGMRVDGLDER
jgi:hypothetical protein